MSFLGTLLMNMNLSILGLLVLFVVVQIALIYWLGFIAYALGMMSLWYIIRLTELGIPKLISFLLLGLAAVLIPMFAPVISVYYILGVFVLLAYAMIHLANRNLFWHLLLIWNDSRLYIARWFEHLDIPESMWQRAVKRLKRSSNNTLLLDFVASYYNNSLPLSYDTDSPVNAALDKVVWRELHQIDVQFLLDYPLSSWSLCRLMLMPQWVDMWLAAVRESEEARSKFSLFLARWVNDLEFFIGTPDEFLGSVFKKEGTEQRVSQLVEMASQELAEFPPLMEQMQHGCSLAYISIGIAQNMTTE